MDFPLQDGMSYFIVPQCAPENALGTESDMIHDNIDESASTVSSLRPVDSKEKPTEIANIDAGVSIISSLHHDNSNQRFIVTKVTKKYFVLTAENSGKVIDVCNGIASNGTKIQLWDYNGSPAQLWKVKQKEDGYFVIRSKINPDYCIDIPNQSPDSGIKVQLYQRNDTPAQKFKFALCPDSPPTDFKEEYRPIYDQWKADHPEEKKSTSSGSGSYDFIDLVDDVVDDVVDALFWWL